MASNAKLSKCRLDEASTRNERRHHVYVIPTIEESRVLWWMHRVERLVLVCGASSVGGQGLDHILRLCDRKFQDPGDDRLNWAVLVATSLVMCVCRGVYLEEADTGRRMCICTSGEERGHVSHEIGAWYSMHACSCADIVGQLLQHDGIVRSEILLYMLEGMEDDIACRVCASLLTHVARYGVGSSGASHVSYGFHRLGMWLVQQNIHQDVSATQKIVEYICILDACLLSLTEAPAHVMATLTKSSNKVSRALYAWIDNAIHESSQYGNETSILYKLRSRMLLSGIGMQGESHDSDEPSVAHMGFQGMEHEICIADIEWLVNALLYWNTKMLFESSLLQNNPRDVPILSYLAWLICSTLFLPGCDVYNPNPLAYVKILKNAIERGGNRISSSVLHMILWVLASKVTSPEEQRCVARWDSIPTLETVDNSTGGHARCMYTWVDRQMLFIENKISIDDTSSTGVIVGGSESESLKTIRESLFPCVLFCPYRTLHTIFEISTSHRSDAWLLVSVCELFPQLVSLPPLINTSEAITHTTELTRLVIDGILIHGASMSNHKKSSYLHSLSLLLKSNDKIPQAYGILSFEDISHALVTLVSGPAECLDLATEFVKQAYIYSGTNAQQTEQAAIAVISACLYHLEFDTRYTRDIPMNKRSIENVREILEYSVNAVKGPTERLRVLSAIEEHGTYPWARLYFGFEFTEYEANYILHINPKRSAGLRGNAVYQVGNISMHQTLELAALGSIQTKELSSLVRGYSSMESFRKDLIDSLRCLFSVCASIETMHLMIGLEIVCSNIFMAQIRGMSTEENASMGAVRGLTGLPIILDSPNLAKICSICMVVELCIRCAVSSDLTHSHMIVDVCQYSVAQIQSFATDHGSTLQSLLIVRVFCELIKCYASLLERSATADEATLHVIRDARISIESTISMICSKVRANPEMECVSLMASLVTKYFRLSQEGLVALPNSDFMQAIHVSLSKT